MSESERPSIAPPEISWDLSEKLASWRRLINQTPDKKKVFKWASHELMPCITHALEVERHVILDELLEFGRIAGFDDDDTQSIMASAILIEPGGHADVRSPANANEVTDTPALQPFEEPPRLPEAGAEMGLPSDLQAWGRSRPTRFRMMRFADVQAGASSAYLVKGLFPKTGLIVIWGKPKCGKSFWAFDVAMHISGDVEYRGRRVQAGHVVYLALEGGEGFRGRIEAFRQRHHWADKSEFYLITDRLDLVRDNAALIEAIRSQLDSHTPVLVVIDTLNRSLAGSESKDEDMAAYIRAADAVRETFDCAVAIVHHCGVDDKRPRGHTSLTGAADAQLAVERDGTGNVKITVEWLKDGAEGDVILSALEQVDLGVDQDGDPISSCVIVPVEVDADAAPNPEEKRARGSKAARIALRALGEAIDEIGEPPPASNHIPATARTTTVEHWRDYAYRRGISTSAEPRARQLAFRRATEHLVEGRDVGIWDDRVWICSK